MQFSRLYTRIMIPHYITFKLHYTTTHRVYITPLSSQSVHEIRAFITQQLNLTVIQSLDPLITLAATALGVLATQQQILHDRATEQEQDQVAQNNAVTRVVAGLILVAVDIGRDDSIEVTPSNNKAEGDTTLVDT